MNQDRLKAEDGKRENLSGEDRNGDVFPCLRVKEASELPCFRISMFLQERTRMIPVLIEQIGEVINETEIAVVELGKRFIKIADRVRSLVKKYEGDSLAEEISEILRTLQFQDITRQRLEH